MSVLVVNAGSSSLKLALFNIDNSSGGAPEEPVWRAHLTWSKSVILRTVANGVEHQEELQLEPDEAMRAAVVSAWQGPLAAVKDARDIEVVGHRVVHGGLKYSSSVIIDNDVIHELQSLVPLAPLHEPASIRLIDVVNSLIPEVKQVAVFDTAYFHSMPEASQKYAIPFEWHQKYGIRKFGFHGISHQYCATRAAELLGSDVNKNSFRVVTCHLGAGSSVTASSGGKAVATTMGFTPLEGLVMGTRSGSIDPGLVLYLLKDKEMALDDMSHALNFDSGMKGISGQTGDMRTLEERTASGDERAKLAIEMFCRSVSANIASLMTTMNGADALVFAGGIGENSPSLRTSIAQSLAFLGLGIDEQKNLDCRNDCDLTAGGARIRSLVIHTKEELAIAHACRKMISK